MPDVPQKIPSLIIIKGGVLYYKKYLLTAPRNAPKETSTLPREFFNQHPVDNLPLFDFYQMSL